MDCAEGAEEDREERRIHLSLGNIGRRCRQWLRQVFYIQE